MWYTNYMENMKRVVVYVPQDNYRELKGSLATQGLTVSGWFREVIVQAINPQTSDTSVLTKIKAFTSQGVGGYKDTSPKKFSKKIPELEVGPTTRPINSFRLCKAKFCNNLAEPGSDFCKEHK